jgi:hypothetical protein
VRNITTDDQVTKFVCGAFFTIVIYGTLITILIKAFGADA